MGSGLNKEIVIVRPESLLQLVLFVSTSRLPISISSEPRSGGERNLWEGSLWKSVPLYSPHIPLFSVHVICSFTEQNYLIATKVRKVKEGNVACLLTWSLKQALWFGTSYFTIMSCISKSDPCAGHGRGWLDSFPLGEKAMHGWNRSGGRRQ